MMRFVWFVCLIICLTVLRGGDVRAASTTLSFNFSNPPPPVSTSITCTAAYPSGQTSFVVPVAAGTKIASCIIAPTNWVGTLALSGTDAAAFAVSGMNIVVGATPISTARTYSVTATSTP